MSWVQRVGKYSNYVAKNYKLYPLVNRSLLQNEIQKFVCNPPMIKSVINGKEINGPTKKRGFSPCNGGPHIFNYQPMNSMNPLNPINPSEIQIPKCHKWENTSPEHKFEIFENLANLIEEKYYYKMMAATMIGQGKNPYEAEIDCIGELVDFLRFNIQYAKDIYQKQPISTEKKIINYSQYLPLQGNVLAITPFNFTAIAGNLATAPLLFGNNVIWKPSEKSLLSNWLFYQICMEAGIPKENLHFIVSDPLHFVKNYVNEDMGGLLFTGSTYAFQNILKNVDYSKNFPRIIGETGGKNFHFVEESANINRVVEKTFKSAFNYSGQKCSACSIIYLPETMYEPFIEKMKLYKRFFVFENYGVICRDSYNRTVDIIERSINDNTNLKLVMGGNYKIDKSFYIEPTIFKSISNTACEIERTELFAPILLVKTYDPEEIEDAINHCINTSEYRLTGAIFSEKDYMIDYLTDKFSHKTGNFYINDKSTGAVVGQQPFGGSGLSGTNDKAGDINMLFRLFNQRTIKYNRNK